MAAPFLLLLLVVSGGAAAGGDGEAGLTRLELRGIDDTGRRHGPFALEEPEFMPVISTHDDEAGEAPRLEFRGIDDSGRGHASDAPEERAFTDVISTGGACGRFARLVAETGNATQLFWERAAGAGGHERERGVDGERREDQVAVCVLVGQGPREAGG